MSLGRDFKGAVFHVGPESLCASECDLSPHTALQLPSKGPDLHKRGELWGDGDAPLTVGSPELPELSGHLGPKERRRQRCGGASIAGVRGSFRWVGPAQGGDVRHTFYVDALCWVKEPAGVR